MKRQEDIEKGREEYEVERNKEKDHNREHL
jgi:hypothetical protein